MKRCLIQLKNTDGSLLGSVLDIPLDTNVEKLHLLCNALRKQQQAKSSSDSDSDDVPFLFYVGSVHVANTLESALKEQLGIIDDEQGAAKRQRSDEASSDATEKPSLGERVVEIVCRPQALVRVLPATRCTATCEGHSEAVVSVQFSPDGMRVASGAGDATVRIWDASSTQSCEAELRRHANWVLAVAWSPLGDLLASADRNGVICVWQSTEHSEASSSEKAGETSSLYTLKSELRAHRKWITSISWRPLHVAGGTAEAGSTNEPRETEASRYLVSASKDCSAIVWDVVLRRAVRTLSGHTACVTSVRWGADNLIYTASEDCTIRVWRPTDGVLCRVLETHAHWVNQLATHVDFVLRTGVFDLERAFREHKTQRAEVENSQGNGNSNSIDRAATRFRESEAHRLFDTDRLASASDDFTVCLWQPGSAAKPLARLSGHKQPVNQVAFAPDGRVLASASFDRSVKLWDAAARSTKAIATLHGHVSRVYQVAFAADSRSLVSAGSDSTVKVWDVRAAKYRLNVELSGHADEVYAVDWSPDGAAIASGSKDRTLKLWRP